MGAKKSGVNTELRFKYRPNIFSVNLESNCNRVNIGGKKNEVVVCDTNRERYSRSSVGTVKIVALRSYLRYGDVFTGRSLFSYSMQSMPSNDSE